MAKDGAMPQNAKEQMQEDILNSFGFSKINGLRIYMPDKDDFLRTEKEKELLVKKLRYRNLLEVGSLHPKTTPVLIPRKVYDVDFLCVNKNQLISPEEAIVLLKKSTSLFISMNELLLLLSKFTGLFPKNVPTFALNELEKLPTDEEGHKRIPYIFPKENITESSAGYGTAHAPLFEEALIIRIVEFIE